ncbi:LysR substrate-binding domain-containing protein [Kiloniella sp.]|uniref:LysR substrate-binding domain-containing protein n=1 Tax=Kiloniella sp. TaxID=1938587 RepID=UPI003B01A601
MISSLPSLTSLRAFEAAGTYGSFKAAANALYVSPTAISHQIRKLEEQLGCSLFERRTRKVVLTHEGEFLLRAVREGFMNISEAVSHLRVADRPKVSLAVGAILASRWLTPKLSSFWVSNPDIDLSLHHTPRAIDFTDMNVDLAIAWGDGSWTDCQKHKLFGVEATPVLSPSLIKKLGTPATPDDLLNYPLIHHRDRTSWKQWFESVGLNNPASQSGITIEDANVAIRTAIDGQGVALGIRSFIDDDIIANRLVQPFKHTITPSRQYYLLSRNTLNKNSPQYRVVEWIKSIA